MYARKEAVRGRAPPNKNNLIGKVACGWTQIEPFKLDTKALFIACLLALKNFGVVTDRAGKRSLPYHQADKPKELNTSTNSEKNFKCRLSQGTRQPPITGGLPK